MDMSYKSLLTLFDYSKLNIEQVLLLAQKLKCDKKNSTEKKYLHGKNFVLVFEKASTRTRCAFEIAAFDQGANVTYLGPNDTHMGYRESICDTAKVLGKMYDGILYRGYEQKTLEVLNQFSEVPCWNGLTNMYHPTQALADLLTIRENSRKELANNVICFVGNSRNNVTHSLMIASSKLGIDFRCASPKKYFPDNFVLHECHKIAADLGNRKVTVTDNIAQAVNGADYIYSDVWVSMGKNNEASLADRIGALKQYQINVNLMGMSNNAECKFMHCLPAIHDKNSSVGISNYTKYGENAFEVTDDVFLSDRSLVFDQAENKLHTIKAIILLSLMPEVINL